MNNPDRWSKEEVFLGMCPPGPFVQLSDYESLRAQLAAAEAERDLLRSDAERYRRMRPNCEVYIQTVKGGPNMLYPDDPKETWDRVIDNIASASGEAGSG